ncbi:MAG: tetratricopeptide repeat protein [Bacteroidetes bacterium]|nr:tetratricopeptide repeat protein [Bacteroidota bacterium]
MIYIVFLLLIIVTVQTHAEAPNKHKVDSLNAVLKKSIPDSVRADTYCSLAREFMSFVPDSALWAASQNKAIEYANQCIVLSEKCGYLRGMGDAYHVLGYISSDRGKHLEALEWNKISLKYRRESGDDAKIATSLFALGYVYADLKDFEQALKYDFESLAISNRRKDSSESAGLYHNIGIIYGNAGNQEEAINYIKRARDINRIAGNREWLAINLTMLAAYAGDKGNLEESLRNSIEAANIFLELGNTRDYGMALVSIGNVLSNQKIYSRALDTLNKALSVLRSIKNKNGIAWSYNHLGKSYTQQRKFKEAAICLDSCLRLCKELGAPGAMRNVYQRLYQLDSASGNLANAYTHYRLYVTLRDSINSNENVQNVAKAKIRFEYSQKEEREKAEQEKKDILQMNILNSIAGVLAGSLIILFVVVRQRNKVKKEKLNVEREKERSENLLLNILPSEVAEELKEKGSADAKQYDNVTVLFTDFKSFTNVSEQLSPQELVDELHSCFKAFDEIITKYNIEKIKTIGDAYLAVCGLPLADEKHAENVVNAALEIRAFMVNRSKEMGAKTFEIRIGINSGSVVAGIVGVKKFAYDIWGDTVNTAARMEQNSEARKINISETTYALVKNKFTCEFRGEIDAKNKGKLKMYFVEEKG